MNLRLSFHVVGTFLKFFGLFLLIPTICSFIYRDGDLYVFLLTACITSISGFFLEQIFKQEKQKTVIDRKEAFLIAFFCWIAACLFGAIPYLLIPEFSNPINAFFESVSGYTTTGATVISNVESLPHGILFYRSFTQWLGGMGIIVLGIAIFPKLSGGGVHLMSSESPGPVTEKLTPKIAETAKKLWFVYIGLSALLVLMLYLCKMPIFDSIVTSFSTLSTGGFSIKNNSIEGYNSSLIEMLITLFMFLGGINFLLHYYLISGRFMKVFRSSELRFYITLAVTFIVIVSFDLWSDRYPHYIDALRYASFQVISILTTTGFSSTDFDLWTGFAVFLLFVMMFVGACSGSTSGSIKVLRILILVKQIFVREVNHLIKPRAVLVIKVDNRTVAEDVIATVTSFFILYLLIFIISAFVILAIEDISLLGALSACAASIGNVGPGFSELGPTHSYQFLSGFTKIWLSILMLLGRLELFTILVIFTPMFWRK